MIGIEAAAALIAFHRIETEDQVTAMAPAHDQHLALSLRTLAPPGIMIGHRLITVGDEHALLPEEASAFERSAVQVRRASGAARIVARALLHRLGHEMTALPKSLGGAPIWPKGVLGSLAHDSRVAVAAVGTCETSRASV
jgi:4'-phosphopantetheinyl transferase EntD